MPISYKNYHPKWSLIVRLIRKRSGDRCEGCEWYDDCRAENGQPHPVTGSRVILAVTHLDNDRRNNRFGNLRHLCQRCHFRHDQGFNVMRRRYGKDFNLVNLKIKF